jgi:predicted nucleic-acid-binding Zn-ribbon protein
MVECGANCTEYDRLMANRGQVANFAKIREIRYLAPLCSPCSYPAVFAPHYTRRGFASEKINPERQNQFALKLYF